MKLLIIMIALTTLLTISVSAQLTDGVRASYSFTGQNATDDTGNGYTLTAGNFTVEPDAHCISGSCINVSSDPPRLTGVTDILQSGNSDWSIAFWQNQVSFVAGEPDFFFMLGDGSCVGHVISMGRNGGVDTITTGCRDNATTNTDFNGRSGWQHYVLAYDDVTQVVNLWINNTLVETLDFNSNATFTNSFITIGGGGFPLASEAGWQGAYDLFTVWNRTLNSSEVDALYTAESSGFSFVTNWEAPAAPPAAPTAAVALPLQDAADLASSLFLLLLILGFAFAAMQGGSKK